MKVVATHFNKKISTMKKRPKFRKGPNQTVLTIYLTCVICGHQHFYHRDTFFLDSGQNYLKKKARH